jgi:hypothetical protein
MDGTAWRWTPTTAVPPNCWAERTQSAEGPRRSPNTRGHRHDDYEARRMPRFSSMSRSLSLSPPQMP